jgi:hypothetical protein
MIVCGKVYDNIGFVSIPVCVLQVDGKGNKNGSLKYLGSLL